MNKKLALEWLKYRKIRSPILTTIIDDVVKKHHLDVVQGRLTKEKPRTQSITINNDSIEFEGDPTEIATDLYQRFENTGLFDIQKKIDVKNPETGGIKKVKIGFNQSVVSPTFTITPTGVEIKGSVAEFRTLTKSPHYYGKIPKEKFHQFMNDILKEPEISEILSKVEDTVDQWYADHGLRTFTSTSCKVGIDNQYQSSIDVDCQKKGNVYQFPYEKENYYHLSKSEITATPNELGYPNQLSFLKDKINEWQPEGITFGDLDRSRPFVFRCYTEKGEWECDFHARMTMDEFRAHFPPHLVIEDSVKYPTYFDDEDRHITFKVKLLNLEPVLEAMVNYTQE